VKKSYYESLEMNLPTNLNSEKLSKIILDLHEKTKSYLTKLREYYNYKDDYIDDQLQIIAEYLAFDYIFKQYSLEREIIEKGMIIFNLSIIDKNS
jgi:hypothetical protein